MVRKPLPAPAPSAVPQPSQMPLAGLFLRLYWLAVGNMVLLAMFARSMQNEELGAADVVYWVFGTALVVVRFIDIRYFHGSTLDGKPATMAHWRRYAIGVAFLTSAAWCLARWIAPVSL